MNTSSDLIYNIDASAFIDMVHVYPDWMIPGLWEAMGELADCGRLIMFEMVRGECKDPEAQQWLDDHQSMVRGFSTELNDAMLQLQSDLDADEQFMEDPKSGKSKADPWLVALAMAENMLTAGSFASGNVVIVCHEKATGNRKGKVKIPDACKRYGIKCIGLLDIVAWEGWKFSRS